MKTHDEVSAPAAIVPGGSIQHRTNPHEPRRFDYIRFFDTDRMNEAKGSWASDILSAETAMESAGLRWAEAVSGQETASTRTHRQVLKLTRRMHHALAELKDTIDIDPERQGAIPVLAGTRFRVSQLLGEIADSDAVEEVAEEFKLDLDTIRRLVRAMAIIFDKPVTSPTHVRYAQRATR